MPYVLAGFILLLLVAMFGVYESGLPRNRNLAIAALVFLAGCMAFVAVILFFDVIAHLPSSTT
jgi:hypothetical protein